MSELTLPWPLHRHVAATATAAVLAMAASTLAAQVPSTRITDCLVGQAWAELVAEFGGSYLDFSLASFPPAAAIDSRGRAYAVLSGNREVATFRPDGVFDRILGGAGLGPGEFQMISDIAVDRSDSLLVLDLASRRVTMFAPDGMYSRDFRLPTLAEAMTIRRVPDGSFLLQGQPQNLDQAGHALQHVGPTGVLIRSIIPVSVDPYRPSAARRHFAVSDDAVWAVRPDRYELELWTTNGTVRRVLKRDVAWFPDRDVEMREGRLEPFVKGIDVMSDGTLLVAIAAPRRGAEPGEATSFESLSGLYETRVELIDPARACVVASSRIGTYPSEFAGPGIVHGHRADPLGERVLQFWRIKYLTRARRPQ